MKDMVQVRRTGGAAYSGPDAKIGRSQFNRSSGLKTTFDVNRLYPIFVDEVLPGDTMTMNVNGFVRLFSPLLSPIMDNLEMEIFWFFCPTRLLWDNWAFFMGEHDNAGAQDTSYTIPVMATGLTVNHDSQGIDHHALAAHMGLPEGLATATVTGVNSLPFRMYNRVYNEWFRDQNVTDRVAENTGNGPETVTDYAIYQSFKKHDYFTSCLPYLQKGTAIAYASDVIADVTAGQEWPTFKSPDGGSGTMTLGSMAAAASTDPAPMEVYAGAGTPVDTERMWWEDPNLRAVIDINGLRQSVAIQRLLERDARGGTRYVEIIKAHFGVTSPDFRLQRPEYLGGGKAMINVSPVANTSATATEDQGELRGVGTGVVSGSGFAKSFTEHGYIMGIMRARGDQTYFQGLDRLWSRSTRYDFYMPALAHLGEQSVLNKEIFVSNSSSVDDAVFGYQERWAEYRMKHSRVAGSFNPDVSGSLSHWHLAEDFATLPALNTTFLTSKTPMSRVQAVTTEDDLLVDLWFNYKCARPIPVNSVPSLVGRF